MKTRESQIFCECLQLQAVLIIQDLVDGFRLFQVVLAPFVWFQVVFGCFRPLQIVQVVLARFSLFLTLVSTFILLVTHFLKIYKPLLTFSMPYTDYHKKINHIQSYITIKYYLKIIIVLHVITKQLPLPTEMYTSVLNILVHHTFCNANQKTFHMAT